MGSIHQDYQALLGRIAARALSSQETVVASYRMALDVCERGVPGDIVECGVFCGAQSAAMALAVMRTRADKRIHLFDSFQGIPMPGPNDRDIQALIPSTSGELRSSGVSASTRAAVEGHFIEWGIPLNIFAFHEGWFQDTVRHWPMGVPISLLRLDGDLYESTKVCMERLARRVSPGGWIIADDFGLDGCRQAILESMGGGSHFPPIYWQQPR